MKFKTLWKGAVLVTASAALIAAISILGIVFFVFSSSVDSQNWGVPIHEISNALIWDGESYVLTEESLLEQNHWAMLIGESGQVVWSLYKPDEIPDQYTLSDVASFTRWYLHDYPVRCWVREDGLLVVGAPKGSVWKYDIAMQTQVLFRTPVWFLSLFLLSLVGVLGLSCLTVRRWFRQTQQIRDTARSNWINGVSHDIRTPLSVVMGYAAQMELAPDLSPIYQKQASAIRSQSQVIRDLVNDLNLTMRLDCEMQPLRKENLQPTAFLRQVVADFLNGGMADGFDFSIDLPSSPLPDIKADPFLLRRAVNNLLINCVRHNAPGCTISLGAEAERNQLLFWIEGGATTQTIPSPSPRQLEPDGGAAHGTGLNLVVQIVAAHGGTVQFFTGSVFRCELRFPFVSHR